ncbi:protein-disulfide reductase DsbD family protein [Flavobacterium beibuense]|uniref:Thiol:disulfide interchange protein dsbD n=1 Tax=Flavobacterium beibuense TaxID=657326 RepID=A0A444WGZ9_9FLAO|nr:cytochrome c biogenesis protein CcdA [Flavobacterium beibuense]RYJ45138.1 Thiol:disulfide interchange protein dsbD [Flavobacterium beibuense]
MKKAALLFLFLFSFIAGSAQILEPVKWKSKVEKKSDTEYIISFDATIDEHWHMYSQFSADGGGLPLEVSFNNSENNYEAVGKATESETKKEFNDTFGVEETFFEKEAHLQQTIKISNPDIALVQVVLNYQVCKESCIWGENLFVVNLKDLTVKEVKNFEEVVVPAGNKEEVKASASEGSDNKKKEEEKNDPWGIFIGTLIAGILVTFTPCVFPMIPMTVSFFIKQNTSKTKGKFNAVFYGLCIIVIYVLISLPFHIFEGLDPNIFANISTNVYLNLFFFIIFVVFAISFFGAFEITMPNSLANKADNASNLGGLLGVFFMALTLIIVSFSCTGPALGFILGSVLSTEGGATLLTIAMFGFGLGLAMPFMLFAIFPSLMSNLPKSGGWLNSVKVVFGFIELALAFKFLSNADLVLQLHLIEREVFIAIWVAIFAALTLYLFGKFSLPHDSPLSHLSVGRMLLGIISMAFTVYLVPGLWGAPLKLISAFPPSLKYSESPFGIGGSGAAVSLDKLPEGANLAAHGIIAFEDYDKGLAYAKEMNKPVMLDFTGYTCVNCRKMEELVWSDPAILSILKNDVVLISLYCDDEKDLPESEQYVSETGKKIETYGEKWSDFEISKYKTNARPFYVLMNHEGSNLNEPVAYTPDIQEYLNWLQEGTANFKK